MMIVYQTNNKQGVIFMPNNPNFIQRGRDDTIKKLSALVFGTDGLKTET